MMGSKQRDFLPLVHVSLDQLVPANHFYRRLDRVLDLAFVRDLVADCYARGGRPSVADPPSSGEGCAQMLQIDPCYGAKSGALTTVTGVRYCRDLDLPDAEGVLQTRLLIVRQLATQILRLREEIETIETALRQRVQATETPLLQVCGVGTPLAAPLLGEPGCTPRIHSAAALAALAGIAPVAVSSGGRHGHRLNRGGNRQLNKVFHLIALCQLRRNPLGQAYDAKKRAERKTVRAAMRCLKRRLVDVVYRLLREAERAKSPHEGDVLLHQTFIDMAA